MKALKTALSFLALLVVVPVAATSQMSAAADADAQWTQPQQTTDVAAIALQAAPVTATEMSPATRALLTFRESDVKFSVPQLMGILRDKRHEGWVLAAYPDPKTSQPLIGAGFSLDLPERAHPQLDELNPNLFIEPSSAQLWQAAGLDAARLNAILDEFNRQLTQWTAREFRGNIRNLTPQITDEDADKLLRIAIIHAAINSRAYCRNFHRLTSWQQMAMTQLVYQMGVNLAEFTEFLKLINSDSLPASPSVPQPTLKRAALTVAATGTARSASTAYWKSVQKSLMQSQWARLYRARAVAVIAMLDPQYGANPTAAERRVSAVLRPVRRPRSRNATTRLVADRATAAQATKKRAKSRKKA